MYILIYIYVVYIYVVYIYATYIMYIFMYIYIYCPYVRTPKNSIHYITVLVVKMLVPESSCSYTVIHY